MSKFPFYKQLDGMDCGPTCLRMIAKYYGKTFSVQQLREQSYIQRTGVNLLGISEAAASIGLRATGIRTSMDKLKQQSKLPCIIHWNQEHFVVLYKIEKKKGKTWFYIADPAYGLLKYEEQELKKCWISTTQGGIEKGIALLLDVTPQFYEAEPIKYEKLSLWYLFHYVRPYKKAMIQLIIGLLAGSLLQLVFPFLTQTIVDQGIGHRNLNFIQLILAAQLMLVFSRTLIEVIRRCILLHISTRVNVSLISDFLSKLMRLPMRFFDSKLAGDLIRRIVDHNRIESFITQSVLNILFSTLTVVIFGIVLAIYSWKIFLIFILFSLAYIGWVKLFMRKRADLNRKNFEQMSVNQNNLMQLIYGMQDIKLLGCEQQKRWEWERLQAKLFKVSIKSLTLGQTQEVGGTFIDQTKNVIISFLAASAVINGEMTRGMMMAMQYIIGQLNAPISQFISFVQATQDAKISLERLNEIQEKPDEEPEDAGLIRDIPENAAIEFRNVVFQYEGPHSDKVLDGIDLTIPHDKVTAIVGESGSGKTTLLKMMLGFYAPVEGDVLLGGRRLSAFSPNCWRQECGTVMQESFVFSDTIANNIAVSDEIPDMKRIRRAVEIANIGEFIESLPLGYNSRIGADGHGLSTGQKQRLLIARAAYKDSKFLFFDEATNSLAANNERTIMERLEKLFKGKTVVIVAHRLSTVRNADNIIVLAHGRIVEQGTHDELTAKRGYYYELVKNQLELGS